MKKLEVFIIAILLAVGVTAFAGLGSVAVGPTATEILPATGGTAAWRWLILQNTSTNDVYLKMDSSTNALTTANGVKLVGGGSLAITATGAANPSHNQIMGISSTGTNTVIYQGDNTAQ